MKIQHLSSVFFLLLLTITNSTQALIVDGKFTGKVTYTSDLSNSDAEYSTYWDNNIVGQAISGSFWYDTDLAPGNSSSAPNQAVHTTEGYSANQWLGINIFIGGKNVDISNSTPAGLDLIEREKTVVFEDYEKPVNANNSDYFAIADVSNATNSAGDYDYKWVTLTVREPIINFVNGTSLEQEFSWVNIDDRDFISLGYFNVKGLIEGEKFEAFASLKLSTLDLSIRDQTTVPEPSSIILYSLGLLVVALRFLNIKFLS